MLIFSSFVLLQSCGDDKNAADAFGNFEAEEVIVSAEATGRIQSLTFEEGQTLKEGQVVGMIDTTQLDLKKAQLEATIGAVSSKVRDIQSQIDVLEEQKANAVREFDRAKKLFKDSAITKKQLDDLEGQVKVIEKNIIATKRALSDANRGIMSESRPLEVQIRQIEDNLGKSYIISPINGVVLNKYTNQHEMAVYGKPLFKIADLDEMTLRAYVSGDQLSKVKIGATVKVRIDASDEQYNNFDGVVEWISNKAEFTPKIIQTKEERVNLVYAIKVKVRNDGKIKIGMPGEVKF